MHEVTTQKTFHNDARYNILVGTTAAYFILTIQEEEEEETTRQFTNDSIFVITPDTCVTYLDYCRVAF